MKQRSGPLKIAMVTNTYPPSINGVARSIESFVAELRSAGHQVVVVAPQPDGEVDNEQDVIRLRALQDLGTQEYSVSIPLPSTYLERLDAFRPDIVHSHHPFLLGAAAVRIAARFEAPLVYTQHAMYDDRAHPVPGNSAVLRRFVSELSIGYANLADTVVAPSASIAAILQNRGVQSPIEIIPTGIDLSRFRNGNPAAIRERFEIPNGAFVLGYVGRLASEKNLSFLSRAVAVFLQRHPDCRFVIAGGGPAQAAVDEVFQRAGVAERVHFTGVLDEVAVAEVYAAIDVLAFASRSETQALQLVEAMAAGVPVVAVDAPGVRELVRDGRNGILLPHASRSAFVSALECVYSANDPQRRMWREECRRTADGFARADCASRLLDVYLHLSGRAPRPKESEFERWETSRRRLDAEWQLWINRIQATGYAITDGLRPARVPILRHGFRWWRSVRRWFSRREWSVKLLNLPVSRGTADEPGLILLQIDGLSRAQLDRALRAGRLPFLRRLLKREHYHIQTMYSGQPTTTPAVLGELFFGVEQAVPAFGFRDHRTGQVVQMFQPGIASRIQQELAQKGEGLLTDGSAYCDIYSGGANESSFCPATTGWRNLEDVTMWRRIALFLMNIMSLVRIACLSVAELLVAIGDFVRGIVRGHEFWRELIYIPRRLVVNIVLRELVGISAEVDATRGVPVLHANFLGYDENSHRRGPDALFAHYALRGIDGAIRRIWNAAQASHRRNYRVWIMADHGQERVTPYVDIHGREVGEAITAIYDSEPDGATRESRTADRGPRPDVTESHRSSWLRERRQSRAELQTDTSIAQPGRPTTVAIGPVGYVYWPSPLDDTDLERLARRMVAEAKIPLVLATMSDQTVWAWNGNGRYKMPGEAERFLAPDHPHLEHVAKDLTRLCGHPDAGDFLISGWRNEARPVSFVPENGAHGGPGPNETSGFVMLSADAPRPALDDGPFRPSSLRHIAQTLLRRGPLGRPAQGTRTSPQVVRLVTYNVHSCIGLDGRLSPSRIARVLARMDPDIVALQELDVARHRSDFAHQAEEIARALEMELHFHPSFEVAGERYGNAVLSRLPMKLIRAGGLPRSGRDREPRGALWVEVQTTGVCLQVINAHLGLSNSERRAQIDELLGPEWLSHPSCREPAVLCGDFNAGPRSSTYRRLASRLHDVQLHGTHSGRSPRKTWFAPLPLARIDHVFVSPKIDVQHVDVPRNSLSRVASDHLPLAVDLKLPASLVATSGQDAGRSVSAVERASLNMS